jgi:hypothetical protein
MSITTQPLRQSPLQSIKAGFNGLYRQATGDKRQFIGMPPVLYRRNLAYRGLRFAKIR